MGQMIDFYVCKKSLDIKIKSNQINQIKSLLLSHHHSTSALVSEILMSVLQTVQKQQTIYLWTDSAKKQQTITYGQTVQKNNKQFTYGQTVQKKQQTIYLWTDSAKKHKQFTYGQTVQKNCTGAFTVLQTVQKNNNSNLHMDRQCKKTTAIYIWTDSAKNSNYIWTVHIYRLYRRQCAKYTYIYSVRLVYYRDIHIINYQLFMLKLIILNYQR